MQREKLLGQGIDYSKEQLLRKSGALYLVDPQKPLTDENRRYLNLVESGVVFGVPLKAKEMRAQGIPIAQEIGNLPDVSVGKSWENEPFTDKTIVEPFNSLAQRVLEARNTDFGRKLLIHSGMAHPWDADFTKIEELTTRFGYLERHGIHRRRIKMIADLVMYTIKTGLQQKDRVVVTDFGPGIFTLEKLIKEMLTPEEVQRVIFVGVDVSNDLLKYGLGSNHIDYGIRADILHLGAGDYSQLLPITDIAVFSEILEHIPHMGLHVQEHILPWLKKNQAWLIGSVPNAVKLVDYWGLITGTRSPNVLRRPIMDQTNDHYSHLTAATLAELLTQEWEFERAGITSNGIPLDENAAACHLYAGLDSPHMGIGLIFWGKSGEETAF